MEAAEAYAFRQLVAHLQTRTDVQNIELMILSGFCRNVRSPSPARAKSLFHATRRFLLSRVQCLSKWYHVGAAKAGMAVSYDDACERVYGMTVKEWKQTHQSKASDEQLKRMEETKAMHAKHEAAPPVTAAHAASPPLAPVPQTAPVISTGMSDVCCVPAEELQAMGGPPPSSMCRLPVPPPTAPVEIRLGVLTVSDRASKGEYPDLSGPEIESCMAAFAATPDGGQWRLSVCQRLVVPDEGDDITRALTAWSDAPAAGAAPSCNLILTTGGTGLSERDVTPEATSALLERATPGIVELLLREAIAHEPLAAISRAAAGVRGRTLIINLPGRSKAVRENLGVLMPLLGHALPKL